MAVWFRHIPIVGSAARKRVAAYKTRKGHEPRPRPRTFHFEGSWLGTPHRDGTGRTIRLYSIADLARAYKVPVRTVQRWYNSGILPPPYFAKRQLKTQRATPYWTRGQFRAIVLVLNDIFAQGIKSLHSDFLREHIAMMREGAAQAVERSAQVSTSEAIRKRSKVQTITWE